MRLIDADKVEEELEYLCKANGSIDLDMLYKTLEKIPTAYDVDKVVERLEELKTVHINHHKIVGESHVENVKHEVVMYNLDKAIKIVKGGGV